MIMRTLLTIAITINAAVAYGDSVSIGPRGINSTVTGLDGSGVLIGQVELRRSGKPGKDSAPYIHSQINPFQVYAGPNIDLTADSQYVMNLFAEEATHALQVAGVMIATDGADDVDGVAPAAQLHSAALLANDDEAFAVTANRIARLSGMRAINASFGGLAWPDGSSTDSEFIDWSTQAHDVLYVVSGSYDDAPGATPQDNFNGITVGASVIKASEPGGDYRQVWSQTDTGLDPPGERTAVDLLAPGVGLRVAMPNSETSTDYEGTSLSAPHVTGTVALLQQYSNQQLPSNPRFQVDSFKQPEVMKAILLNSADKLPNVHGSRREIQNKNGNNWTTTTAFNSEFTSLDIEMGAGHLNADSALENLKPGEYDSGAVPPIGWDFGSVGAFNNIRYAINQEVSGWVAITLAWNRLLETTGDEDDYHEEDIFINSTLNNLDLYLVAKNSNDFNNAIGKSTTGDDNLEHIFVQVPPGEYDIVVQGAIGDQEYGLAWWMGELSTPGDFDADNDVDGADFLAWQRGNSPNPLSADDLADWQANYGTGSLAGVGDDSVTGIEDDPARFAVPEPGCLILLFGSILLRRR